MNKSLLNQKVKIVPDLELEAFEGIIILFEEAKMKDIIIKVLTPFDHEGFNYEYLIASPRHVGNSFDKLLRGEGLLCSILRLPPERITFKDPFDTSWWRGGGSFIGDVIPLK